jgi:hypothetical protein
LSPPLGTARPLVIDGEAVVADDAGLASFELLRKCSVRADVFRFTSGSGRNGDVSRLGGSVFVTPAGAHY